MDIVGMYIGIWVARDEIEQIFGLDPVSSARVFWSVSTFIST